MTKSTAYWIAKGAFLLFGTAILLNAFAVSAVSNFNLGSVLTALLGALLLLCGLFYARIVRAVPRWVWITFVALIIALGLYLATLLIYGSTDTVTYEEDALIVLGAAIHGERVSLMLRNRLDAAVAYYRQNPDVLIVVSGGQGAQEDISEALAMERYLIERGVRAESILKEDRSTSTKENFAFSKALLDERLGNDYSVAFVTSEFHIFRARGFAREAGFDYTAHAHSGTAWYLILPNGLRELVAILYSLTPFA
jgi:uncharacterized SAM-binding protein YcdF (DUF218 family)